MVEYKFYLQDMQTDRVYEQKFYSYVGALRKARKLGTRWEVKEIQQ